MPIGKCCAIGPAGDAEGVARGQPALLARGGGEARVADHVAGGEDVRHRGAEGLVDLRAARARRPSRPGGGEVERRRGADAAGGEDDRVGDDPLARLEEQRGRRGGPSVTSSRSTVSPRRKMTPRLRIWCISSSTISWSRNSRKRSRFSTSVTFTPSAENIDAYSRPMTPGADDGERARQRLHG